MLQFDLLTPDTRPNNALTQKQTTDRSREPENGCILHWLLSYSPVLTHSLAFSLSHSAPRPVNSVFISVSLCCIQAMLKNPPVLQLHSSVHSSVHSFRLPGVGLTSASSKPVPVSAATTATSSHHGNRSGGVGGKLSSATIKCMQRRRARNT